MDRLVFIIAEILIKDWCDFLQTTEIYSLSRFRASGRYLFPTHSRTKCLCMAACTWTLPNDVSALLHSLQLRAISATVRLYVQLRLKFKSKWLMQVSWAFTLGALKCILDFVKIFILMEHCMKLRSCILKFGRGLLRLPKYSVKWSQ